MGSSFCKRQAKLSLTTDTNLDKTVLSDLITVKYLNARAFSPLLLLLWLYMSGAIFLKKMSFNFF